MYFRLSTWLGPTHPCARGDRRRVVWTVLGTVAFTMAAGVLFSELRRLTGNVPTPIIVRWATNGFGVVAAARIWVVSRE